MNDSKERNVVQLVLENATLKTYPPVRMLIFLLMGFFYISGLLQWLFPSGIPIFPPLVSAIVTQNSKNNNNDLTKSIFAEDLTENNLLLDNFGPGSFASSEELASDEENDAKLYNDVIQSIKDWQIRKIIRDKRKLSNRLVCFLIF